VTLGLVAALGSGPVPADTPPPRGEGSKGPLASSESRGSGQARLDALALAQHIDKLIGQKLKAEKVELSPRTDDAEFLRRVYLDITGHIPTAEQAQAFLDSKESDKRARLIDQLLSSKDFGKHQADVWQSLMLPRDSEAIRLRQYFPNLIQWLEEGFNDNKSWDKMVRELLTATGPVDKTGPSVYYVANMSVDKVTDNFTKLFLGVQLQCAQCHNHPFTDWKQTEYWGMAAFFMKVRPDGNPRAAAKNGTALNIVEVKNIVRDKRRLPESAKILPPKYLQGAQAKLGDRDLYRPALADWATSPGNPFLARAMVNRTWSQFFGRGFVNPVDDMHEGNLSTHPELLQDLTSQFVASGFDVKYLIRAICNSDAYQRTSKPTGNNGDAAPELFARMAVKVMTPEQLFDSLTQVVGSPGARGQAQGKAAGAARRAGNPREQFVAFFRVDDGASPVEYQAGIPQVLRLMNAQLFNNPAAVQKLTRDSRNPKESAEKLYLATLSRRPTPQEVARVTEYLQKHNDEPRQGLADVLWVLLNSSEFALNH